MTLELPMSRRRVGEVSRFRVVEQFEVELPDVRFPFTRTTSYVDKVVFSVELEGSCREPRLHVALAGTVRWNPEPGLLLSARLKGTVEVEHDWFPDGPQRAGGTLHATIERRT